MAMPYVPYDGPIVTRAEARVGGLTRYFTNKPCPSGHISQRQVRDAYCVACARAARKVWADAHPDYGPGWYLANKPKHNAQSKAWRLANLELIKAAHRAWHLAHPGYSTKKGRAYALANPETVKAARTRWRLKNMDYHRTLLRNRRAKKREIGGKHTATEIKALYAKQKAKCAYCRKSIKSGYHADHIMPIALGGSNAIANIQLTCAPCNLSKNRKHPVDFARSVGLLI